MILQTIFKEYQSFFNELRNALTHELLFNTSEQNAKKAHNSGSNQMINSTIPKASIAHNFLVVAVISLLSACSSSEGQQTTPPPPTVTVSVPLEEAVTRYDEFTGRFRAVERVEVRARVDGYLEEIKFRDGQLIEKGDVLFVIDQRPYKIALEQAKAQLESAQTRLELAKKELERAQNLRAGGAVSQELIDRRNQEYLSARSAVSSAESEVHSAELDLEFTKVKAPVSGKISENFVSIGNLVSGGLSSATLLTRIVSFDPIYFTFEASESKLISYLKDQSFRGEVSTIRDNRQKVQAKLLGEEQFTHQGILDFIDNEIDQSTGTLLVRAVFQNHSLLLTPGMFAKARFSATGQHRELLIPDKAIASDQSQRYVLTVDDSSKVSRKVVETGTLHNNLRIIEQGLTKADRVIVNGASKVRPGQTVNINQDEIAFVAEDHQP